MILNDSPFLSNIFEITMAEETFLENICNIIVCHVRADGLVFHYTPRNEVIIPPSTKLVGVYWIHPVCLSVRLSVCLSVNLCVSAL